MNRAQKQKYIEDLNAAFKSAAFIVVTTQAGLSAGQTAALRGKVNQSKITFKVSKNRLTKIAIKGTPYEGLSSYFKGVTGIAFAQDPVSGAKVMADFANDNSEKFGIIAGAMGDKALDAASVKRLASLPSLDQLRAQLIGLLQAPASKIARIVKEPAGQLARVTNARGSQASTQS